MDQSTIRNTRAGSWCMLLFSIFQNMLVLLELLNCTSYLEEIKCELEMNH